MSNAIQTVTHTIRDRNLTTIIFRGEPHWLASEVSLSLGYALPDQLAKEMSRSWKDRFRQDKDFIKVVGGELSQLKQVLGQLTPITGASQMLGARAPHALLLTESGVNLSTILANTPEGDELRFKLADEVLPSIARTGGYQATPVIPGPSPAQEAELFAKANRMRADSILMLAEYLKTRDTYGPETIDTLMVTAAELGADKLLPYARPEWGDWETPTEIADRHEGITPHRVGKMITALGLRGKEGYSKSIRNSKKHSNGEEVKSYIYNRAAVDLIEAAIVEWRPST